MSLPNFQNAALLEQAMTHRSYAHEQETVQLDNERLEFLGDAVLTYIAAAILYEAYPDRPEGELTAMRAALVDEAQLAAFAKQVGIPAQLRLGRSAEQAAGRQNPNLLSSAFEAAIGAYLIDTHYNTAAVRQYVEPLFQAQLPTVAILAKQRNVKSRFQEWALATHGENPHYQIVHESGPPHDRWFTAIVTVKGQEFGRGEGRRKQDAEKAAAAIAIDTIPANPNPPPLDSPPGSP